ncbi:hypothetical protein Tcan_06685 [Toxocara canis]|uniref:Uncharacterized protein n=1 Tax=Toxocara canis TaxID=6265 RepID=A0A0B2W1Y6_TOXCA|nr:hypothetical protein Tcan_06685 [Toxocara canis]
MLLLNVFTAKTVVLKEKGILRGAVEDLVMLSSVDKWASRDRHNLRGTQISYDMAKTTKEKLRASSKLLHELQC